MFATQTTANCMMQMMPMPMYMCTGMGLVLCRQIASGLRT